VSILAEVSSRWLWKSDLSRTEALVSADLFSRTIARRQYCSTSAIPKTKAKEASHACGGV